MARLVVSLLAVSCAIAMLASCGRTPKTYDAFMSRGKHRLEQRDYPRALLEFKNAAAMAPKNAEPFYQIAVASLGAGDPQTAIAFLKKALDLDPKHKGAQLAMAQLMANARDRTWVTQAESRLKSLMDGSEVNPEVLNTLAFAELKLGKTEEAMQSLEQVLANTPGALQSSVMLATAKLSLNDIKGAEAVLRRACEAAPNAVPPRLMLGKFYRGTQRPAEAEAEFQHALKIDPKSGPALMELAILERGSGRKQEAEQNFKRLAGLGDDRHKAVYGQFLFEEGRSGEAIKEFERVYTQDPKDRTNRTRLIAAYREANRSGDAEKLLEQVLRKNPKDLDALQQRGEYFIGVGKYAEAEDDLNRVVHLSPNSPTVHYTLSKLYQKRGWALRYRQELAEALRLNPRLIAVRLELANSLIGAKDTGAALELLNAAPLGQKELSAVTVARNWAHWTAGDLTAMRKGIDFGLSRERSVDLLIQDGLWKLRSGNAPGARLSLEAALKLDGTDIRALRALAETYSKNEAGLALQKVKEYSRAHPESAPVQDFTGLVLVANGFRKEAREAFLAAKKADATFAGADLSLAQMDFLENHLDDSAARLELLLKADPSNNTARIMLGGAEALRGNNDGALTQFRQAVETNPNDPYALNNLAYILAEYRGDAAEALKYAQKAQELAPDNPEFADTLGWVLYRKGLYSSAVTHLERAATKDGNPVWKYHLAMAYAKSGKPTEARNMLTAALKNRPDLPEAKLASQLVGEPK